MKPLMFFVVFTILARVSSCGGGNNAPLDQENTYSCEYDYEPNWSVLNRASNRPLNKTIEDDITEIFNDVGSSYLRKWKWLKDSDNKLNVSDYWDDTEYIKSNEAEHQDYASTIWTKNNDNINYHVLSVGSKIYENNYFSTGTVVGGISSRQADNEPIPDNNKQYRYSYIFVNDILQSQDAYWKFLVSIRHILAHELGHQLAGLTHSFDVVNNSYVYNYTHHFQFDADLRNCCMAVGMISVTPPFASNSFFCKDSSQGSDVNSCSKYLIEKLDN